jgi:hypothetical protein
VIEPEFAAHWHRSEPDEARAAHVGEHVFVGNQVLDRLGVPAPITGTEVVELACDGRTVPVCPWLSLGSRRSLSRSTVGISCFRFVLQISLLWLGRKAVCER